MGEGDAIRGVRDGSAWTEFCRRVEAAGRRVIAAAPDDPFERAEGLRYVGRIARHGLLSFIEESDPSTPRVTQSLPKLGGDNPDYVYGSAPLSGEYEYRLRGSFGDSSYLGIGTYYGGVGTPTGLQCSGYLAGKDLATDGAGRFEILLSCEQQPGNWLSDAARDLAADDPRAAARPAPPAARALRDRAQRCPERPAAARSRALRRAARARRAATSRARSRSSSTGRRPSPRGPTTSRLLDEALASGARGDPNTHYYAGYYQIGADEALLVDFVPPRCEYWNLQLCNHWLESLDYWHHTIHVNHHTAVARSDGSVRVVDRAARSGRAQLARYGRPPPRLHLPAPGRHAASPTTRAAGC